ncbi:bifunctional metallophosphatase/5'-nucleotidase [Caldisericum exile]|uniref:5'-nucleotidase n=1 Tax=Caldisericum exile (strain DSM 21853 / NBRC 104410 / AZM16c01) TaxID=511051 RepID=A0A7U6GDZ3_CALEA|nr:5'-nucleotidase C-terminal domain-containing protein [Caldisericum exile]BAL80624.1 putative 5'-nucleotidase [Caldisericum exile AZM16c01]
MNTKKFTILHSNDMHGDFMAEMRGEKGKLVGGLSLLSGYINKVRSEEENVLYVISGDMVQGSIIDTEFKGISTIELMNYLAPDVATLGNHEFDYGLPHLLFLEKVANFPIVNANLYIKPYHKRLMKPYTIINKAGFDILFIGIITQEVIDALSRDKDIGSFITLEEARDEVGRITNAYKDADIDLTILLTHIGFENDKKLASMLDPNWGVDIIIGGHSHTILEKPEVVNGILIAQAGVGTDQIGRFDVLVDDDTNSVVEYNWQLIPIEEGIAPPDFELEKFIDSFKEVVERKYNVIVTRFGHKLTHPDRKIETELGNLFADIFKERADVDVAFVGSGSIRAKELGPVVTLGDLKSAFPFQDTIHKFFVTGETLFKMFNTFMSNENKISDGEHYQVSKGVKAVFNTQKDQLESLSLDSVPVKFENVYTIALQGFHYDNFEKFFKISAEALKTIKPPKVVSTSQSDVIEEYLNLHQNIDREIEGRLVYIK